MGCLYWPFRVNKLFSIGSLRQYLIFTIICAFILQSPHLFDFDIVISDQIDTMSNCSIIKICRPFWQNLNVWYHIILGSLLKFIVPLLILIVITITLWRGLSNQKRKFRN